MIRCLNVVFSLLIISGLYGQNIEIEPLRIACGPSDVRINALYEDSYGLIWIGTERSGVFQINNGRCTPVPAINRITGYRIQSIGANPGDTIIINSATGSFAHDGFTTEPYTGVGPRHSEFSELPGMPEIICSEAADLGMFLLGTTKGLFAYNPDDSTSIPLSDQAGVLNTEIRALLYDRNNQLWIATQSGLYIRKYVASDPFTVPLLETVPLLASPFSETIYVLNRDTSAVLSRQFVALPEYKWAALGRNQDLWLLDSLNQLVYLREGSRLIVRKMSDVPRAFVGDRFGSYWIESDDGLAHLRPGAGGYKAVPLNAKLEGNTIAYHTYNDRLYRVSNQSIDRIDGARVIPVISVPEGIVCSSFNEKGQFVIATLTDKLLRVDINGAIANLALPVGLAPRTIEFVATDGQALWLGRTDGLFEGFLNDKEINNFQKVFDPQNGSLRASDFHLSSQYVLVRDGDEVWFIDRYGRQFLAPPEVILSSVILESGSIESGQYATSAGPFLKQVASMSLPYHSNNILFSWVGISSTGGPLYYSWRLDGSDGFWSAPTESLQVQFTNLEAGSYTFWLRVCDAYGNCSARDAWEFKVRNPVWKNPWLISGLGLSLALLVIYSFRRRLARVRKENARELSELRNRLDKLNLEQRALRLQMNPHFMSNAFQAMDISIASGSPEKARHDLRILSQFMRQMLLMTRNETTSLEAEFDFIELYAKMENTLRGDQVDFMITAEPDIEAFAIEVPTMILQPIIENAIQHGGPRIRVNFVSAGDVLQVDVEDNGPGLKISDMQKHDSVALNVIRERLEIINGNIRFESPIFDGSHGTRVTITIPLSKS